MVSIKDMEIDDDAPEDTVQFVKHLEENLDPNEELNSAVWIETVRFSEIDEFPTGEFTGEPLVEVNRKEFGVRMYVEFEDNSDALTDIWDIASNFYGGSNQFVFNSSFDGGTGEYEAYVFPVAE